MQAITETQNKTDKGTIETDSELKEMPSLESINKLFVNAAQTVVPSVVSIVTEKEVKGAHDLKFIPDIFIDEVINKPIEWMNKS